MNEKEIFEYRNQLEDHIKAIGRNPDDDLQLVTVKEMRQWLDERDEKMRAEAMAEEGENYNPEDHE